MEELTLGWGYASTPKEVTVEQRFNLTPLQGAIAFSGIAIVGASIGATIGTYIFFGTTILVGGIAVIESQPWLKKCAKGSNQFIDIVILGASIYATATLGVTVAASLTFAGLGYTLVYAPYLRGTKKEKSHT